VRGALPVVADPADAYSHNPRKPNPKSYVAAWLSIGAQPFRIKIHFG